MSMWNVFPRNFFFRLGSFNDPRIRLIFLSRWWGNVGFYSSMCDRSSHFYWVLPTMRRHFHQSPPAVPGLSSPPAPLPGSLSGSDAAAPKLHPTDPPPVQHILWDPSCPIFGHSDFFTCKVHEFVCAYLSAIAGECNFGKAIWLLSWHLKVLSQSWLPCGFYSNSEWRIEFLLYLILL